MQATKLRYLARTRLWASNTRSTYPRHYSYVSTHSAFPATLYRFQVERISGLYDKKFDQDDWKWEDGVEIANDGLVHPKSTADGTFLITSSYMITNNGHSFKRSTLYAKYPFHARNNTTVL